MYTREQRQKAIDTLIRLGHSYEVTVRELGYPSVSCLKNWWRDSGEASEIGERIRDLAIRFEPFGAGLYFDLTIRFNVFVAGLYFLRRLEVLGMWPRSSGASPALSYGRVRNHLNSRCETRWHI